MAQAESLSFPSITPIHTAGGSQSLIYSGFDQWELETKHGPSPRGSKVRYSCDIIGCTVTFKRSYDLARHKRTVHGPKVHCPYPQCTYATARSDKMKAHNRKKHFDWNAPRQAKEIIDASEGFLNSNVSENSWYTNGSEMYGSWTGGLSLDVWSPVDWNSFWSDACLRTEI